MSVSRTRARALLTVLLCVLGCRDASRVDAATLHHAASGPQLRVTILGDQADSRVTAVREALAHWNREFARLERAVRFDSGTVRAPMVSDSLLRAASGEVMFGRGPATTRLHEGLTRVPGDLVISLSGTDLISFGVTWRAGRHGVVGVRRADIPPLSLPNTVRNVIAHELGHVLGLEHNRDSTTLMCGRPARCRPALFASDSTRFFPLTSADEAWIRKRWP